MAYANPSTFVAAQELTAAQLNVLANNDRFLHGRPTALVRRAAVQSLPNGSWAAIVFDTEDWDSNTIWSSTDAEKLKVRTAGKYTARAHGGIRGSTAGTLRGIAIVKNSTSFAATDVAARQLDVFDIVTATTWQGAVSQMFSMTTSDYLTLHMIQNRGSTLGTSTTRDSQPTLSVLWESS